ncbi:hypothetical protein G4X40_16780 [Rhodococcus sp. D2-41]|uniref:hypothetical protein n=1 Tax=Speluncibacter jeojiensis TaxID=2710754 RepID=UPI00240F85AC|nr:hypothetical protein [Rhodococcus sp. D2-41]MDG3011802.1 hypothetical protein [Rhodococcus sp. D2-41]
MTSDQIRQLLDASRARLAVETHTPDQPAALSYARALWALEDDLRTIADQPEGTVR